MLQYQRGEFMNNPFIHSNDNKRYHTFNHYLKTKYQTKVAKISLNGHFSCPNIDGTVAYGGCTFCDAGSAAFLSLEAEPLLKQFDKVKTIMDAKWPNALYIAYFQANTNTHDTVENLKLRFEPFVNKKDVVAIYLATRSDCLSAPVLDYLETIRDRIDLVIELGLQTIHDHTAKRINRGHDFSSFVDAVRELRRRNLDVCVHLINGLPGETIDDMRKTASVVASLDIQFVKLHLLYITKGTGIEKLYQHRLLEPMTQDDYVALIVDQLEYFHPDVVVQRLTGDGHEGTLIAPMWAKKKVIVLNEIDKLMVKRDTYQGKKYANYSIKP